MFDTMPPRPAHTPICAAAIVRQLRAACRRICAFSRRGTRVGRVATVRNVTTAAKLWHVAFAVIGILARVTATVVTTAAVAVGTIGPSGAIIWFITLSIMGVAAIVIIG
jgi:hypothetical protein